MKEEKLYTLSCRKAYETFFVEFLTPLGGQCPSDILGSGRSMDQPKIEIDGILAPVI